jgi:FKBP-type peptidyl-prolyl cis-trans isomerase SlyD
MKIGDLKKILVSPEEGYGYYEEDDEAFAEIPVHEFPEDVPLDPGVEVMLQDDEGDEVEAYITEVLDDIVYLSLNHPLAGKELDFEVKIVGLRAATPEELEHEHVHED